MKRLLYCVILAAAMIACIIYSRMQMDRTEAVLQQQFDAAQTAAENENMQLATAKLQLALEQYRQLEHTLAVFVRRDTLTLLDTTLCSAISYAVSGNAEEMQAELARAQSQFYAMRHLLEQLI